MCLTVVVGGARLCLVGHSGNRWWRWGVQVAVKGRGAARGCGVSAVVLAVLVVGACGGDDVGVADSLPVPSVAPAAGVARPAGEPFGTADEHCGGDGDAIVETAFVGTVSAIDRSRDPAWVTFEVAEWFTNDTGTVIALWAPEWEGTPGEEWLIAGSRYGVGYLSSGEVFWCESEPVAGDARQVWIERYGAPVVAGAAVPERSADPAVLAAIDAAGERWTEAGLTSYSFAVQVMDRRMFTDAGGTDRCGVGTVRVVVDDGEVVQARDLSHDCDVPPSDVPTIDGLFDVARANAGALQGAPAFDDEYGYLTNFYANDRSVEVTIYVDEFVDFAAPLDLGDRQTASDDAKARWAAAGPDDYTATVEVRCSCDWVGTFEVVVENGTVDTSIVESPDGEVLDIPDVTVDGLFETLVQHIDDESIHWAFHPELGYPVAARLDPEIEATDDELELFINELTILD